MVVNAVSIAVGEDVGLLGGVAEFLGLLLSVEEYRYAEDGNAVDNVVVGDGSEGWRLG